MERNEKKRKEKKRKEKKRNKSTIDLFKLDTRLLNNRRSERRGAKTISKMDKPGAILSIIVDTRTYYLSRLPRGVAFHFHDTIQFARYVCTLFDVQFLEH